LFFRYGKDAIVESKGWLLGFGGLQVRSRIRPGPSRIPIVVKVAAPPPGFPTGGLGPCFWPRSPLCRDKLVSEVSPATTGSTFVTSSRVRSLRELAAAFPRKRLSSRCIRSASPSTPKRRPLDAGRSGYSPVTSGRGCEELHAARLGSHKVDIPESRPRVSIAMALWQTTDAVYALSVVELRARGNRQSIASPDRCARSRVDGQGK